MEVRQRPRPTGERWFDSADMARYLIAFGDDEKPLQESMRVLDIIAVECAHPTHERSLPYFH